MNHKLLCSAAIFGNVMYILWIVYNGVDEGGRGIGTVQAISLSGLLVLLTLNIFLIHRKTK